MKNIASIMHTITFMGLLLVVAWSITKKQFDWMIFMGLPLLIAGTVYNMIDDWKKGRKVTVMVQLGVLLIALILIIAIIFFKW